MGSAMPPRGVKSGTKRARQYERIKESELDRGSGESRAEEIAAPHGQQGACARRRVPSALAHLDRRHLIVAPRGSPIRDEPGEGPDPR